MSTPRHLPPSVFATRHHKNPQHDRIDREYRDAAAQAERKIAEGLPARVACLHAADCAEKIAERGGFDAFQYNALAQKWRGRAKEHEAQS